MNEFSFSTESKIFVYNLSDGRVLFQQNSNIETKVASLTKIMTTILAIENNPKDKIVDITTEAVSGLDEFVVAGLTVGQKIPIEELYYITMLPSAGDAAQALAIATSGSIEKFVEKMNEKAKELGLTHTHFSNVVGFDSENYSSAEDIEKILEYALKNQKFSEVFSSFKYFSPSLQKTFYKTIEENSMILGAKTGFTYEAGRNLASFSEINGAKLLVVDLNEDWRTNNHLENSLKIYDFFLNNYSYQNILENGEKLTEVEVRDSAQKSLEIFSEIEVKKFLENNFPIEKLEKNFESEKIITNKSKIGDYLGKYSIKLDEEILYEQEIFLETEINFYPYWLWNAGVVALTLAILGFFFYKWRKNRCRSRRRG